MLESLFNLKMWFLKLVTMFFIWFQPAKESALLLIFLIIVDGLTDIWVKLEAKEKFSLKALLVKQIKDLSAFLIYILSIYYFQVAYLKQTFMIFNILAGIPIIACLVGIIENVEKITGISVASKAKAVIMNVFDALTLKATGKKESEETKDVSEN
jgi:phage-related holin